MDFVLDSDSDVAMTPPRIQYKSRLPPHSGSNKNTTKEDNIFPRPAQQPRATSSLASRGELEDAYNRLETPKSSYSKVIQTSFESTSLSNTKPSIKKTPFEASRERMKLANIIDSETNDDTENLFMMPINIKNGDSKEAKDIQRSIMGPYVQNNSGSKESILDLDLSGISDAEDIIAEFTNDTQKIQTNDDSSTRKIKYSQLDSPNVAEFTPKANHRLEFGRLLQVDSGSDPATPRLRSIREELDSSKTRFRQSINELLNSSPINSVSFEKATGNFKEMVKVGSKLGEHVLKELESLEKIQKETGIQNTLKDQENDKMINDYEVEEEISEIFLIEENESNLSIFLRRFSWAFCITVGLFFLNIIFQALVLRQQMTGSIFPSFDYSNVQQKFEEAFLWLYEKFSDLRLNLTPPY